MKTQPHDFGTGWQGLEPKQPRSGCSGFGIALLAAFFLLLGIAVLAFYLGQQSEEQATATLTITDLMTATPGSDTGGIADPTAMVTVVPAATATLPTEETAVSATIPRAASPPVIDGDLTDWPGRPLAASIYQVYNAPTWDGTDDLAASWRLAWDDTALYVAVEVTDDRHVQTQTGNLIYRGDSVEIQLDTNREADLGSELSPDDYQINLSPGDFAGLPPSAFQFQATTAGSMRDAPVQSPLPVAARLTEAGYILEAAIPWAALAMAPVSGQSIGIALNVSDNDEPGTAVQEVMKSHMPGRTFSDPTTWDTLRFE